MGFIKEFKEFALKGNVIDLAIAVIIGAAFGAIISSLVTDIITPLILTPALEAAHVKDLKELTWGTVKYGSFLASVLNFIVIAFSIFAVIKGMNSLKRRKEAAAAEPTPPEYTLQEKLLMEIRDSLKK
jgi:large conductance mechanosensitive channel